MSHSDQSARFLKVSPAVAIDVPGWFQARPHTDEDNVFEMDIAGETEALHADDIVSLIELLTDALEASRRS